MTVPFVHRMSRLQTVLGWIYLPLHIAVLPLLLGLYAAVSPEEIGDAAINLIYFGCGIGFVLLVMLSYLRAEFDALLDRPAWCAATALVSAGWLWLLSFAMGLVLLLLPELPENPNNAEVMSLAGQERGVTLALTIFIGPIVEEVLFRGTVFGSLRRFGAFPAYAASTALFALYHVWQYALLGGDWGVLLYALQYLPVSIVLAWSYARSGSLWLPIFFHMGYNALAFAVLSFL